MDSSVAAQVTKFPLFHGLTVDGVQFLLERGAHRRLDPGEVLCREGEAPTAVFLLLDGVIDVFVVRNGRDLLLNHAKPGAIVGELAVLCGLPRAASLRAAGAAEVIEWSTDAFRHLLFTNPSLSERIMRQSLRVLVEKEHALVRELCETH
jgi:CRP-like cAMP-binding protein